jgi:LPXTG-site transpeptidase (sortase) family protein
VSKPKVYKYKQPISAATYVFYRSLSNIFIILGVLFVLLSFGSVIKDEVWYQLKQLKDQKFVLKSRGITNEDVISDSIFARYLSTRPISIEPINTDFSIVIEKIGVNVPIVPDVYVTDEAAYMESLKHGVAHASVSNYPSTDPGNTYLFAHASTNFWQLGKYANVFNLLRKLDLGDRVHVFYNDKVYVYEVVNKEVMKGWNTYPLTRPVLEPTLTLQTCDPPGTTLNRLVVTAKLVEVRDY